VNSQQTIVQKRDLDKDEKKSGKSVTLFDQRASTIPSAVSTVSNEVQEARLGDTTTTLATASTFRRSDSQIESNNQFIEHLLVEFSACRG
jgi:hypothetical protein